MGAVFSSRTTRFPSPLVKPDVEFSSIRLTDHLPACLSATVVVDSPCPVEPTTAIMERLPSSPNRGSVFPPFGLVRPTAVSHHGTVSGTAHRPFTHVHSLTALMQPSQPIHMMEVWPHAQDEFCCLVRHHFRATPTPRTSMTASCRSHPACRRLTAGGVSFFPAPVLLCVRRSQGTITI
jgi:hypothetical protein